MKFEDVNHSFMKTLHSLHSQLFSCWSLLVVKSFVTHCKIPSLLVAEVVRFKKSLVTRCKIHSFLVAEVAPFKKLLVTHCKIRSLLVVEVAHCKKITRYSLQSSLVIHCEICLLLVENSLVTRCRNCLLQKNFRHSLWKSLVENVVYLKSINLSKTFSFFNTICFVKQKNWKLLQINALGIVH